MSALCKLEIVSGNKQNPFTEFPPVYSHMLKAMQVDLLS